MKKSIYEKLEDIPEADRGDYQLCTDSGSPNLNKYVLQLDGYHPVQVKNSELLGEKQTREQAHQTAIQQKDAEIQRISGELQTAKSQQGLPAGQVAVSVEDSQLLTQFKGLGEFKDIKVKVDEHAALKEKDEAATRRSLLTEAARAHGFDPDAFVLLAEPKGVAEVLTSSEVDDGKGGKVRQYFVKGKDTSGAETTTVLSDFVQNSDDFKPFLASLQAKGENGKVKIPPQRTGDPPKDKSAGESYINSTYKRPDKTE